MEVHIIIKESENGKPSVIVKEGDNPKPNSKRENSNKNQGSNKKSNSGKEKLKNGKIRSLGELEKRRKWLLKLKESLEADIKNGKGNLAELRQESGWLETVIAEYSWIFGEID